MYYILNNQIICHQARALVRGAQVLHIMQPSDGGAASFAIDSLSSLKNAQRFGVAPSAGGLEADTGGRRARAGIDPGVKLLELSTAREAPLAPLVLTYWQES